MTPAHSELDSTHAFALLREESKVELSFAVSPLHRGLEVDQVKRLPLTVQVGFASQNSEHPIRTKPIVDVYGVRERLWIVGLHIRPHRVRVVWAERAGTLRHARPAPRLKFLNALSAGDSSTNERIGVLDPSAPRFPLAGRLVDADADQLFNDDRSWPRRTALDTSQFADLAPYHVQLVILRALTAEHPFRAVRIAEKQRGPSPSAGASFTGVYQFLPERTLRDDVNRKWQRRAQPFKMLVDGLRFGLRITEDAQSTGSISPFAAISASVVL